MYSSWSLWLAIGRPVGSGTILERGIFSERSDQHHERAARCRGATDAEQPALSMRAHALILSTPSHCQFARQKVH
jgi:hypothetical protein